MNFEKATVLNTIGYGLFVLEKRERGRKNIYNALKILEKEEERNFYNFKMLNKRTEILAYLGIVELFCSGAEISIKYQKQALRIRKAMFGKRHLAIATQYGNLGMCFLNAKNYQKAKKNYEKSNALRLKLFPNGNTFVITGFLNLIKTYIRLDESDKIEQLWKRIEQIFDKIDDKNYENHKAPIYTIYSCYLLEKKNYEKSSKVLEKAYEIIERNFSELVYISNFKTVVLYGKVLRLSGKINDSLNVLSNAERSMEKYCEKNFQENDVLLLYMELFFIFKYIENIQKCYTYIKLLILKIDTILLTTDLHNKDINHIIDYFEGYTIFFKENHQFCKEILEELQGLRKCDKCEFSTKEFLLKI